MAPVAKGRPIGLHAAAVHGVGHHRGADGVVRSEHLGGDGIAESSGQHLLLLDGHGILRAVGVLIVAEVLIAQGRIVEDTDLDGHGRARGVGHAQAQADHAGLVGAGVGQRNALGEGQVVHAPNGLNDAALLRDGNSAAAGVFSAKNVVPGGTPLAHTEGEKRGIVLSVVVEQFLVVVGLFQAVALHRADGEAAVALADGHAYVIIAEGIDVRQLCGHCAYRRDRHQTDRQGCGEQPRKQSFLHLLFLLFLLLHIEQDADGLPALRGHQQGVIAGCRHAEPAVFVKAQGAAGEVFHLSGA